MSHEIQTFGSFDFQFEHALVSVERKGILKMLKMEIDGTLTVEDMECILNHIVDRELQTQEIQNELDIQTAIDRCAQEKV